jgi:hypothetical protein
MGLIRAGNLRSVVYLLRRGPDQDNGYGKSPGAWRLLGKRMASVQPVRSGEAFDSAGISARRESSLWLWHDSAAAGMTAEDGVAINGVVYHLVDQPREVGRGEGIELVAVASDPPEAIDPLALDAA